MLRQPLIKESERMLPTTVTHELEISTASDIRVSSETVTLSATKPPLVQTEVPSESCCDPAYRVPLFMINPSEIRKPSPRSAPVAYGPWKREIKPLPDTVLNLRTTVVLQLKLLLQNDEDAVTDVVSRGRAPWPGEARCVRTAI